MAAVTVAQEVTVSQDRFRGHFPEAEEAAHRQPVFVSDGNEPTLVILDVSEYRKLKSAAEPSYAAAGAITARPGKPFRTLLDAMDENPWPEGVPIRDDDFPRSTWKSTPFEFD